MLLIINTESTLGEGTSRTTGLGVYFWLIYVREGSILHVGHFLSTRTTLFVQGHCQCQCQMKVEVGPGDINRIKWSAGE